MQPIRLPTRFAVGLSWDEQSSTRVDMDISAVAIDGTSLVIDACFFNDPCPAGLGGSLRHAGDARDGSAKGVDERIDVDLSLIPPYTYAIAFIATCAADADFGPCESAQMHCFAEMGQTLLPPMALGGAAAKKATVVILAIARRTSANGFAFSLQPSLEALPRPARTFMDACPVLLPLIGIDPVMAQELRGLQPTFNLIKGESVRLPVGMTEVCFGHGWDSCCDVDASRIGLGPEGNEVFTVYFGNRSYGNGIVVHSGDNLTGQGDGDDEQIIVRLPAVPLEVAALFFTVNVYTNNKDFTDVDGEFCRLFDASRGSPNHGREIVRYKSLDSGKYNGVVLAGVFRNPHFPQQWEFVATALPGMGRTAGGLVGECKALHRSHVTGEPLPYAMEERRRNACKSSGGCCIIQ